MLKNGTTYGARHQMLIRLKNDNFVLKALIFFMPFSFFPMFNMNLGGPGLKIFNIMALVLLLIFVLKGGFSITFSDKIQFNAFLLIIVYILLFAIAFFRTFFEYNNLPDIVRNTLGGGSISFFLSYFVKPCLFFVPCLFILRFIHTEEAINNVIRAIVASVSIFSLVVIAIGFDNLLSFSGVRGRSVLMSEFGQNMGMHYNSVATALVLAFPLALYASKLKQDSYFSTWLYKLAPFIVFTAGVVSQSRTAILLLILSFIVIYLIEPVSLEKRFRKTLTMLVIFIAGITIALPVLPLVFDLGGPGADPLNYLLSGRLAKMWLPLSAELSNSSYHLFFGFGLYGIMQSDAYFLPDFFQATHAHNAYLNFVVDTGLAGFLVLSIMLFPFMKKLYRKRAQSKSQVATYLLTVLIVYLYAALTGRSFFPGLDNYWLFVVVALSVSAYRIISRQNLKQNENSIL